MLDESTAELAKLEFSPMLSTIEAIFKIRKAVPLHTTLRIECEVRFWHGTDCSLAHAAITLQISETEHMLPKLHRAQVHGAKMHFANTA